MIIENENHCFAETLNRDFADWQVRAQEPNSRQSEFAFADEIPFAFVASAEAEPWKGAHP